MNYSRFHGTGRTYPDYPQKMDGLCTLYVRILFTLTQIYNLTGESESTQCKNGLTLARISHQVRREKLEKNRRHTISMLRMFFKQTEGDANAFRLCYRSLVKNAA